MGILRPIVLPHPAGPMTALKMQDFHRHAIRGELIGDDGFWMYSGVAQQALEQLQRRMLVATHLDQNAQNLALVIDRPPIITTASSRCQRPVGRSPRQPSTPQHPEC